MTNPAPQHHHDQNPGRIIQKPDYLVRAIDAREEAWAKCDKFVDLREDCKNDRARDHLQFKITRMQDYARLCDLRLDAAEDAYSFGNQYPDLGCQHPLALREVKTDINQSFTGGSYNDTQTDTVICGVCGKIIEEN